MTSVEACGDDEDKGDGPGKSGGGGGDGGRQRRRGRRAPRRGESTDECVVCYEPTDGYVVPCGHRLCRACGLEWFPRRASCPYCVRTPLAHAPVLRPRRTRPGGGRLLRVRVHSGLGLTVTSPEGVVTVCAVPRRGTCHAAGLRCGHVIVEVNGILVTSHDVAIALMEGCQRAGVAILLHVEGTPMCWPWRRR